IGSPETGKFSTALLVSAPQSSFSASVLATRRVYSGGIEAAAPERPRANPAAEGLVERRGRGPTDVATARALALFDAPAGRRVQHAHLAAAETLDSERCHLQERSASARTLRPSLEGQSVEYFG